MANDFELTLTAARPAISSAQPNVVDVLVRLQAPDQPRGGLPERRPINLGIVIDRSGSMSGQPLHEAKRAANYMMDHLKPSDRASIVVYDDEVSVLVPSQPVKDREHIRAAIDELRSGGSTNLHGGWLKGAEEAAAHLSAQSISRVLLLSDGQANCGLTNLDEIATQCAKLADAGVSTSTYGLGHAFNEDLMVAMARSGRGSSYFSESADSLLERFQEEFALLSALCARNVRLHLTPSPSVRCDLLNPYEKAGDGSWRLPDLAYEGEGWAAVRLHMDADVLPAAGESAMLLDAQVVYDDLEGAAHNIPQVRLSLRVVDGAKFFAMAVDPIVVQRHEEAAVARLQREAADAAYRGNWNEVQLILEQARAAAVHSPWVQQILEYLDDLALRQDTVLFKKESRYASTNLSTRQRTKSEFLSSFDNESVPAFQRVIVRQGAKRSDNPKKNQP